MASGPFLGRVLAMLSMTIKPNRILEIGTFTGYSALCLAEGLADNGELITIEINDELKSIQDEFFSKSQYGKNIRPLIGEASKLLPDLTGPFQLVFLDADKENYHHYLPMILDLCEKDSIILIDNMLWEGKVIFDEFSDPRTDAIRKLTESIKMDSRLEQVLLPVRDGLMMVRVKDLVK
jgi:predicted O-methyltransferase YrrM